MIYAFVLGRTHTLSIAEILAVCEDLNISLSKVLASPEVFLADLEPLPDIVVLQKRLGGTVKILKLLSFFEVGQSILKDVEKSLKNLSAGETLSLSRTSKKINVGLSFYFLDEQVKLRLKKESMGTNPAQKLALRFKSELVKKGFSARAVLPENNYVALSSAVVWHNKLLEKGAEVCLVVSEKMGFVAKTVSVQDFEDYGRRDFQRPVRDMQRGMTPPKLAQVMVNIAKKAKPDTDNSYLWDPFCGLGTFVQEGVLMGLSMLGSDMDLSAVAGAKKNLEWLQNRYHLKSAKYELFAHDARSALDDKTLSVQKITGIVTEGTLGPVFTHFPTAEEIQDTFGDLFKLYQACFKEWEKILPVGAKVVMCLPGYRKSAEEYILFPSLDFALQNSYNAVGLISPDFAEIWPFLRLTSRRTAIYDRKDQIVAREIVIFEKI